MTQTWKFGTISCNVMYKKKIVFFMPKPNAKFLDFVSPTTTYVSYIHTPTSGIKVLSNVLANSH